MKKIFANVFSFRGVLTVLCAGMASEALAVDIGMDLLNRSILCCLTNIFVFYAVLLLFFIALGYGLLFYNRQNCWMRRIQLLLIVVLLLLWGILSCAFETYNIIAQMILMPICLLLLIAASLISGVWTYRKDADALRGSALGKWFMHGPAWFKSILLIFLEITAAAVMFFIPTSDIESRLPREPAIKESNQASTVYHFPYRDEAR